MTETTTDPNDPRLKHGIDTQPVPQNTVYLVLSEEERSKGFVRPYRDTYIHVGQQPVYPLLPLTSEQNEMFNADGEYVAFEAYPSSMSPKVGRFWTQAQLDNHGCGGTTTMSRDLAETYARQPNFYGSTYCVHCQKHLSVKEFVWAQDNQVVGS
jgi:hypothetical protein